jgi:hypothetical protein
MNEANPLSEQKPLTVNEAADRLKLDVSRVRLLCQQGRIPGAVKLADRWFIPAHAVADWQPAPTGRPKGTRTAMTKRQLIAYAKDLAEAARLNPGLRPGVDRALSALQTHCATANLPDAADKIKLLRGELK